ncbi:MAG: polysaccharide biosynthesis C-terminal domain-containing protein [Thiohalomonadales bacterium]
MQKLIHTIIQKITELLSNKSNLADVIHAASIVMFIRVLGAGVLYISHILLARWMGNSEFGIYAYAWVWLTVLGVIAPFGLNIAVVRFLPDYLSKKKWRRVIGVIRHSQLFVLCSSLILTALAMLTVYTTRSWIPDYYITPLYIAFASIPIIAYIDLYEGMSRSFNWIKLAFTPSYILLPTALILLIIVIIVAGITPTASIALSVVFIAAILALMLQVWIFHRKIHTIVPQSKPVYHSLHWLRNALPFLLVDVFYLVLANTDIILLGKYMEPDKIAIYYAAVKTSNLILFILFAVSAISATKFSELYAQKKHQQLSELYYGSVRWTLLPALIASVILFLAGKLLLSFFGPAFVDGYVVLVILTIGILFKSAVGPIDLLLNMTENQKPCAVVFGYSAGLNIILNLTLIPYFGLIGAAFATTLSVVVSTVWLAALTKKNLNIHVFRSFHW